MRVTKRNGESEPVSFDKILKRIQDQAHDLSRVNVALLTQKVIKGLYDGVKTSELDTLAAETAEYMSSLEPQYSQLASRLAVSNLHKETKESFRETMEQVGFCWPYIVDHEEVIQQQLDYTRDFSYSYFGLKTLCRSYLLRKDGRIVERPQHMLMRVSLGIWKDNLERAFETYHLMSNKMFTHASPTLFNSGTHLPQMSSCFLLDMTDDSIRGIYETLARCADISKSAGGIGLHVHKIRASGTEIRGTNGTSNGLVPMLQVYNATARYVDQGGGKRKGAFAIYLEPWHADIFQVLQLKKNTGADELRARDLFYAMWVPDLFMKRVEEEGMWSSMCP